MAVRLPVHHSTSQPHFINQRGESQCTGRSSDLNRPGIRDLANWSLGQHPHTSPTTSFIANGCRKTPKQRLGKFQASIKSNNIFGAQVRFTKSPHITMCHMFSHICCLVTKPRRIRGTQNKTISIPIRQTLSASTSQTSLFFADKSILTCISANAKPQTKLKKGKRALPKPHIMSETPPQCIEGWKGSCPPHHSPSSHGRLERRPRMCDSCVSNIACMLWFWNSIWPWSCWDWACICTCKLDTCWVWCWLNSLNWPSSWDCLKINCCTWPSRALFFLVHHLVPSEWPAEAWPWRLLGS